MLCIGLAAGVAICKIPALADNSFWSGTANGQIVPIGTVVAPLTIMQVAPESVGQAVYPNGMQFDLKNLQPGQQTSLNLFVRNTTKKMVNVYPLISNTPNVDVQVPLSNSRMYPGQWTQFLFQIRALTPGPCSVKIEFAQN
jgi:hypothetical protein